MKRSFLPAGLALALILGVAPAAFPADTVEIKLATILPVGTSGHQNLMEMRAAWQKAAGPAVKLTIYAGMAEGEPLLVKKMRARQINAALLTAVGLSEIDRSVSSLQLMPMMFRDWREVDHVREKVRPELEARLRAKGFEVLFWGDAGWVRYFSKEPGAYPDDYKKMKLFVLAGVPRQMEIMRELGYQPVSLETEQILPALTTGMVSVVPVPPFLANALQFNRQAKYMLDLNWAPIVGAAIVRSDVWQKIPPALRAQLQAIAAAASEKIRTQTRAEDDDAIVAMKKNGLVVQSVTPPVLAAWRALAARSYPMIRGPIVPPEIFDRVQGVLAEFRAAHGGGPP
ncbi:MAG: TRAP transporter substrate-binding protein DctP [Verrucomicrobia bacterium]|nr:TRAP transporter substrate-binding protein DctP [Verrucomicrobiota bacterium]